MALINNVDTEYLPPSEYEKVDKNRFEIAFEEFEKLTNEINDDKFIKKGELIRFFKHHGNTILLAAELLKEDARIIIKHN